MHNCTLSAASGPLHYDKGRRRRGGHGGYREERQHSFDDDNEGSRAARPIPGIEMMENGKKNDSATMYGQATRNKTQ